MPRPFRPEPSRPRSPQPGPSRSRSSQHRPPEPRTGARYDADVLAGDWRRPPLGRSRPVEASPGLVVEEVGTGWVGAVVRVERSGGVHLVVLEDRRGRTRSFPLGPGFWVDGEPVVLGPPRGPSRPAVPTRTASGSVAVRGAPARVARGSRIWVEGRHDAELLEHVWGDDLRVEGVVVEPVGGIDDLTAAVADFAPGPGRRLGVLVDHLVDGTKESRLVADAVAGTPGRGHVLVTGHPFVDVWQAVRPERLGLAAWPQVPRGEDWKRGILRRLGWPHADQADVARGWKRVLGTVRSYADLEPALLGPVEHLIDFVTADPGDT